MERVMLYFLAVCMLLPMFTGCGRGEDFTGELWIVTEQTTWDRMNGQTRVLIEEFEKAHEGVTIRLDMLPTGEQERSVYLQLLRTQILQGGGPDGYLLPTDNTRILDEPAQYTYVEADPLFADVELAMRNGLFYDITEFYDADDALGKDGLNTVIMDAGVVDGARYVLPLRYDMPVIYAEADALADAGLDASVLTEDIQTIMEKILSVGDPVLAGGIAHDSFSAFSDFIDYDSGNAALDAATLTRYLGTYQQLQALLGADYLDGTRLDSDTIKTLAAEDTILMEKPDLKSYILGEYGDSEEKTEIPDNVFIVGSGTLVEEDTLDVYTDYYPLYIGSMTDAFSYASIAKYEDTELTMVPMRSVGGDVVATVAYYAAVGSGCKNPELTYEFLRLFLSEESQWELNRPERKHTSSIKSTAANSSNDLQYPGLIGNGWAVRSVGSVEDLWEIRRKQIYVRWVGMWATDETKRRMRQIGLGMLEESEIPLMDTGIDQVRFNTTMSEALADTLEQLNDRDRANVPTGADIENLAQQLIWNLRWHVSEG